MGVRVVGEVMALPPVATHDGFFLGGLLFGGIFMNLHRLDMVRFPDGADGDA